MEYRKDRWLTFDQACIADGPVRKGKHGKIACSYKLLTKVLYGARGNPMSDDESNPVGRHFALFEKFHLFNVAQCDSL